jgi:hypothetical protein
MSIVFRKLSKELALAKGKFANTEVLMKFDNKFRSFWVQSSQVPPWSSLASVCSLSTNAPLIICLVPVHFGFRLNSSFRPAAAAVLEMT